MKEALEILNLPVSLKKQVLLDVKEGRLSEKKVIGMSRLVEKVTGKECMREVGLYYLDGKYRLRFALNEEQLATVEF